MNMENVKKLYAHIKSLSDESVDMNEWYRHRAKPDCGSVGCIGGRAAYLSKGACYDDYSGLVRCGTELAKDWLGLSSEEAHLLLFEFPEWNGDKTWKEWTWEGWVLRRLEHVIEDGQVKDWDVYEDLAISPGSYAGVRC